MSERQWPFEVHDARARTYGGIVTWAEAVPTALQPPLPPHAFHIVLLSTPIDIAAAPEGVAICVPAAARVRALRTGSEESLVDDVAQLTLPPHRMAEFAEGRIVMAAESIIDPTDIFPSHSDRPRLDRLALTLIEIASAEAIAPYTAMIRIALHVPRGVEVLNALEGRLLPRNPAMRPPAKAPAVMRLSHALEQLRHGDPPVDDLDTFREDLRVLELFENDGALLEGEALERLMTDVRTAKPPRKRGAPAPQEGPAKIIPLRPPPEDE